MVSLRDKIMVVGFPMGGTELSLSNGIVSRIQVDEYSMSSQRLLQAQVDAAVNPGNSGGPVFIGNKVVGVAFQGYNGHQGLNYIIPIPIMQHFLDEALSGKPYRGFPTMPITTEEIENLHERAFYGMGEKSGVRILKVDRLSDAYDKLKPNDIILSIDGFPVSNEGTVDIPSIGNCIDCFHITQSKFIGDKVKLTILRKTPETNAVKQVDIEVILDTVLGDTKKVPPLEHDKMPTYYINSGICFIPLTRNYMEGDGCEFEDMYLVEDNCLLPDAPKNHPDDQFILINNILNCKETQGYNKHIHGLVKAINGQPVNNIVDVVHAMESDKNKENGQNKSELHEISLKSGSTIVIPGMSEKQQAELLKRHHVSQDRSLDLPNVAIKTQDSSQLSPPERLESYVEDMEFTQSGMHALFARMGYPDIMSGSIYADNPTLNLKTLNHQGFLPVLADVSPTNISGHWIMLIKGHNHEYFMFDPMGENSGKKYTDCLSSQLPPNAKLSLIPNQEGFNRGLCGYWVASTGLQLYAALHQNASPDLAILGEHTTQAMQNELQNNGFMNIITWMQSLEEQLTEAPAAKPINAKVLRQMSEEPQRNRLEIRSPVPQRAIPLSLLHPPIQPSKEKPKPSKRRQLDGSSDLAEQIQAGRQRWDQMITAMEERYKNQPLDEEEEDDDYAYTSEEDSDSGAESEYSDSDGSIDIQLNTQSHAPRRRHHGFFKPSIELTGGQDAKSHYRH